MRLLIAIAITCNYKVSLIKVVTKVVTLDRYGGDIVSVL